MSEFSDFLIMEINSIHRDASYQNRSYYENDSKSGRLFGVKNVHNLRVCALQKVPVKRFKICHTFDIRKPMWYFSFHDTTLFFPLMNALVHVDDIDQGKGIH